MIPSPGEGLETVRFHCRQVALCSIHSVSFYIYCYAFSKDSRDHPFQILNPFPVTWNSATSISHSLIDSVPWFPNWQYHHILLVTVLPALQLEYTFSEKPRPFYFYFIYLFIYFLIFKLYIIVLVLPNIKMNPPQVYMCSPSQTLLPPPSPYHPSGPS